MGPLSVITKVKFKITGLLLPVFSHGTFASTPDKNKDTVDVTPPLII